MPPIVRILKPRARRFPVKETFGTAAGDGFNLSESEPDESESESPDSESAEDRRFRDSAVFCLRICAVGICCDCVDCTAGSMTQCARASGFSGRC